MAFFTPSDKATSTPRRQMERKYNFPFDTCPLGMSFPVGKDEVLNLNVLRAIAGRNGKKLGRKFKVIDHGEQGFEVFYKESITAIAPLAGAECEPDGDIVGRYRG